MSKESTANDADETNHDIGRSTRMMSVLVIVSRITGFLRTWAQAFAVGATIISSCYTLANNLHLQLNGLVSYGLLVTGFMPVYMSARHKGGQREGNEYISNLLSIAIVFLGIVTLACIVLAPQFVWLQSFNASSEFDSDLAAWFFRFFSIEFLLYAVGSIFTGINNADREFFWSNIAPSLNNIVVAVSFFAYAALVGTNPMLALLIIAIANPIGVAVQAGVQVIPALRRGVRLRFHIDLHDPHLRETIAVGVPMVVVTLATFVGTSVQTSFALSVTAKASSILYYSQVWYAVPYSVFSIPLSTALFTEMAENYSRDDFAGFKRNLIRGLNSISFYLIPCTFLLIVFSTPLTRILSGSMTPEEISMTASYLSWVSLSLPLWGISTFLQKAASSMRDMRFFTGASITGVVIQILLCVTLTPVFGLPAIALSILAFYGMLVGVTLAVMRRRVGALGIRSIVRGQLQSLVAGIVGTVVGAAALWAVELVISPQSSAVAAIVTCAVAGLPALVACVWAGARVGNPTAAELAGTARRTVRRVLGRAA